MTPRKAEALTLLLPLTLVVPLLWHDLGQTTLLPRVLSPEGLATLVIGVVAFALGARYFRPGYSLEPNNWGVVVGLAAMGVYFYGSVQSVPTLHWAAGGLLYLGAIVYLGGPDFAAVALPAVGAILAVFSGLARNFVVGVALWIVLVTYMAATFRLLSPGERAAPCAHCDERLTSGSLYCFSCGRGLALPSVRLGRAKVGKVLLTSGVLLILAVAQPAALDVTHSGINYTIYSAAGEQVQPLITSPPPGWRVTNETASSAPTQTSTAYDLTSAHSDASLLVTLWVPPFGPPRILPGLNTSLAGSVELGNQSLAKYRVTNGSASLTELAWSAPVSYLSGATVSTGTLSFVAAEPTAAYNATAGKDLLAISSSVVNMASTVQIWGFALVTVGSYILQYGSFIIPSMSLIAVLLFVGRLRGLELRDSRVVDTTFGLSSEEFSLYAALVREPPLETGAEYEAAAARKGVWDGGGDFCQELGRLERLGLISTRVRVRGGAPTLLWKCELA